MIVDTCLSEHLGPSTAQSSLFKQVQSGNVSQNTEQFLKKRVSLAFPNISCVTHGWETHPQLMDTISPRQPHFAILWSGIPRSDL